MFETDGGDGTPELNDAASRARGTGSCRVSRASLAMRLRSSSYRCTNSTMIASFESKWWYRLPGRMPQASAISLREVRRPEDAKSVPAV